MLTPRNSEGHPGQSLVEYVLTLPIMLLVLVGGFGVGMAMYQAHMASDAIRQPALQKLAMAASDNAICGDQLLKYVNEGKLGGNLKVGRYIDSVSIHEQNEFGSVLVGHKTITPIAPFLPTFDIKVTQVVNRNLLYPSYMGNPGIGQGAAARPRTFCKSDDVLNRALVVRDDTPGNGQPRVTIRPANVPWVPYGTPNVPPWEGGVGGRNGNLNAQGNSGNPNGSGARNNGSGTGLGGALGGGGNLTQNPPTQTAGTMGNGGNGGQNW